VARGTPVLPEVIHHPPAARKAGRDPLGTRWPADLRRDKHRRVLPGRMQVCKHRYCADTWTWPATASSHRREALQEVQ